MGEVGRQWTDLINQRHYQPFTGGDDLKRAYLGLYRRIKTVQQRPILAADSGKSRCCGMIYSMSFNPTGAYLVATCSQNCFVTYDPRFDQIVNCNRSAHNEGGVNCVTFCGPNRFVTGSEDGSIAVWDARRLGTPISRLFGHSFEVKNIEYDWVNNQLLSVAFDRTVLGWNLDGLRETVEEHDVLFRLPGVIRIRLNSDCSKLAISTSFNCVMCVNNFDGGHISKDMLNSFEVMKRTATTFSGGRLGNMLDEHDRQFFTRRRNGVSFHTVFNHIIQAHMVSLCFHPTSDLIACRSITEMDLWDDVTMEMACLFDLRHTEPFSHENGYQDYPHSRLLAKRNHTSQTDNLIKEVCFSPDGRLIASADSNSVKLLAVNGNFDEPNTFYGKSCHSNCQPQPFHLVDCSVSAHRQHILCCTFAPQDILLVTGSSDGEIFTHQPVL